MLEQFFPQVLYKILLVDESHQAPQETIDRQSAIRAAKAKKGPSTSTLPVSTGAWPQQVGIHRVTWNNGNGLGSSTLLASATASGLCRVDCLFGRWFKEKMPYGGIRSIRMEDEAATEDDDDMIVDESNTDDDAEGEDEDEEMQDEEGIDD